MKTGLRLGPGVAEAIASHGREAYPHECCGALIERACACARDQGCSRLVLAVNKRNANAIAAYRKHGFVIGQSVVKDIGRGFVMDDYLMVRSL